MLADAGRKRGLNVWVFTGHTFEELLNKAETNPDIMGLLKLTDVLVDGKFILSERTLSMKWRGSKNQRFVEVAKSLETGFAIELEL
jgi:anaerobic ribonucleoside-triphosphate reductase activating protein